MCVHLAKLFFIELTDSSFYNKGDMHRGGRAVAAVSRRYASSGRRRSKEVDLGWERLRAPLETVPMHLPALAALQVGSHAACRLAACGNHLNSGRVLPLPCVGCHR